MEDRNNEIRPECYINDHTMDRLQVFRISEDMYRSHFTKRTGLQYDVYTWKEPEIPEHFITSEENHMRNFILCSYFRLR